MPNPDRHKDRGEFTQQYLAEMLVKCPRCGAPARIREGRLICLGCDLVREKSVAYAEMRGSTGHYWPEVPVTNWFWDIEAQAILNDNPIPACCTKCNGALDMPKRRLSFDHQQTPNAIKATCGGCGTENIVPVCWRPLLRHGEPRDPLFGCDLVLTAPMRDGVLYAYNAEHARDYLAFIEATHRERDPDAFGNNSWFTKLPAWIKSAKNRDKVTKVLRAFIEQAEKL